MSVRKRRADRLAQQKKRGGKASYVTLLENARIILAWEAGELTAGQAAAALGVDLITARLMRMAELDRGAALALELLDEKALDPAAAAPVESAHDET